MRKIDKLGRIVLPIDARRRIGLTHVGDGAEIWVEGERVILRPPALCPKCREPLAEHELRCPE